MKINNKISKTLPGRIGPIIRGLVFTYLLLAGLTLILSLVFYFTPLSESWIGPLGIAIITVALFFGGRETAKTAGNKGLIHGLILGILFILITIIISVLLKDISWASLAMKSLYALLASVIGGITGVK